MAHTRAWSTAYEAIPAGSDAIREGDDRIRELKSDVRERMTVEHAWKEDQTFDGMHAFAQNLAKTTATLTEIETFIGAAGGNTVTLDPTLLAGKPYFVMKNDSSANPVTVDLASGNWNNIAVAEHTFYPGSLPDIVLANRGDYIWGICDGTDFWIYGLRRSGLRIVTAATVTIDEFDDVVLLDGTSNTVDATLPAANLVEGKIFHIKTINIDNVVTIIGTVDGVASPVPVLNETYVIASNGTEYKRLNKYLISTSDILAGAVTEPKLEDFTASADYTASTIAFADSNPDTITDSANGFGDFSAGQSLVVSGSGSNDGTYTIDTVTAGTITLKASDTLAGEGEGASVTLTGIFDIWGDKTAAPQTILHGLGEVIMIEAMVVRPGIVRWAYDFSDNSSGTSYLKIYLNGAVVHPNNKTTNAYTSHTYDMTIVAGDRIKLTVQNISLEGQSALIKNFYIGTDINAIAVFRSVNT